MDHLENVNDKTRELILNIEKDMEKMLSSFRLNHCKYVMYKAVELANIYGVDVNKAALAGLTHDIVKEFSREQYLQIAKENNIVFDEYELMNESLMHAKIGAWWVKEHYGFGEDIQRAIELHTITDKQMDDLAKIIFVADKIEDSRENNNFDIEYERKISKENLDKTILVILNNTIKYMLNENKIIHPSAISTRNYLLKKFKDTEDNEI